jgi:hypothetical protein
MSLEHEYLCGVAWICSGFMLSIHDGRGRDGSVRATFLLRRTLAQDPLRNKT